MLTIPLSQRYFTGSLIVVRDDNKNRRIVLDKWSRLGVKNKVVEGTLDVSDPDVKRERPSWR